MTYKKLYTLPLFLSLLTTFSLAEGEPTELKTWNIRETSVKIAFKNNLSNTGYDIKVVDEDGTHRTDIAISFLSSGSRDYIIRKISGLKPATHYQITVISEQGGHASEPIEFDTLGERGRASDLKTWNIKETSVKIAFKDNLDNEQSYSIMTYKRGEHLNPIISYITQDTSGQGKIYLQKVRGLQPNTEYTSYVLAVRPFDGFNGLENYEITSKPIDFKTKGETPQPNQIVATDLHTWGVKNSSAMISFVNHAPSESDNLYFVNADTDERMTLNSKGVIPVPNNEKYSIGKMIDLTPDTTYHIKIMTDDDSANLEASETITFKTKS